MTKKITISVILIASIAAVLIFTVKPEKPTGVNSEVAEALTVIAQDLEIPWDFAFLPTGEILLTERPGRVLLITDNNQQEIQVTDTIVTQHGESGLLGITLHPDFSNNQFVYLYHTQETEDGLRNRVVRYTFTGTALTRPLEIIGKIPGARYHDGGRIEFGPDRYLYITTGDATTEDLAQDRSSLAGKVLRLRDDGSIPADNPFGTAIYSYGHRNSQGLAWDAYGRLWSTEHGRSGLSSGLDEINLIHSGENYGWPQIQGDKARRGMVKPATHSGPDITWAPASAAYYDASLFFGGLRGEALYEAVLEGETVVEVREHFKGQLGRIRTIRIGPDGYLYLTTSNRDGRGNPAPGDDKLIRIDPGIL
ncbi:MAG: glucose sorbosone dehydrogenase [Candidatus Harrisonbacteria bacterium CG10_big_fil_rev_8_21_14_0_10_49_15]|uniref:Glucose sorbosone dehydrogenase n=1 Tax=Candidatus Harrisonbacteria bacterium CG10_big_fil_rev_8_21_14_0_10_49_15 TaxID=1974587 RepID=A0A2H0UM49_9BACT|nr:MAG: glucose sorbosone dehydrogenase [Candidatus Harrisonbacteria bacterium CG10_big_fil_rev_8_21_14_0_10_49_15]